jgi:hypothetical protein
MVCVVHLLILQIHASSFETGWWRKMAWYREACHGLGVQDAAEFNSDFWEENKKKGQGLFTSVRHTLLAMLCGILVPVRCN